MSLSAPPALVSFSISFTKTAAPSSSAVAEQLNPKPTNLGRKKVKDNNKAQPNTSANPTVPQSVPFHTPEVLTEYERDQIKHLVEDVLPTVAPETVRSIKYLKLIHRNVFSLQYRDELASIGRRTSLRRILYACVVRQVIINDDIPLPTVDQLYEMPFYEDNLTPPSQLELESLRHFMRAIQTLHEIGMPAASNKKTYIDVAAMLDGSKCTYALGGAPSKATMRRVMIYHGMTGIEIPPSYMQKTSSKRRKIETDMNNNDDEVMDGTLDSSDVAADELAIFDDI
jgi:hypothetical protein